MPHDFSPLDFLTEPDQARAREMQAARRRALQARLPGAMALALGPEVGGQAVGRELLRQEAPEEHQADALAEARLLAQHRKVQEQQGWAGLAQGRWVPVVKTNPTTGETIAVMVDSRTGRERPLVQPPQLQPSHAPSGEPPLPPMRLTSDQSKLSNMVGAATESFPQALTAGFPTPTVPGGVSQTLQQMASRRGFPALASKTAVDTDAFWYNVVAPLINLQTGQQMSYQEYQRRWAGMAPRPGESLSTQEAKARMLLATLRNATLGLPQPLHQHYQRKLDRVEAMLGAAVAQVQARGASPQPSPVGVVNGRPVGYRE